MLISPRSYQTECVLSIWEYFRKHQSGNPICALPTGTGKSICIASFLETAFKAWPHQKVLVLTHVKELIAQNFDKLMKLWPQAPAGIYSAGLNRRDVHQKIIFAGIASIAKKPEIFGKVDLIIVDECHLISPSDNTMYQKVIQFLTTVNPLLRVVGFTATYYRLGHGKITEGDDALFTDICFDITTVAAFNRLIAEGFLAPLIPKPMKLVLDTDGVSMRGGDFVEGQLQKAVDKTHITVAAVKEMLEVGYDRKKWLIFCTGVEHAQHTAEILELHGVSARAVYSGMPDRGPGSREEALQMFHDGRIRALVNNNILTTGFDEPGIDLIGVLRPTQSSVLWVQMLGRGTRPCPAEGKVNCLVLDFAANTKRLGPINDPVVPRKKGSKGGEAPVKLCPVCDTYQHASVRWCTGVFTDGRPCTHEFIFETKLNLTASNQELIRGELPVVETFKVDHITYSIHTKADKPPAIRVTYYCGYRMFNDFVCVEHGGYASKKAREWMRERLDGINLPESTLDALHMADLFKIPTHLRIWINKKHPEIMAYCYDGRAFGTQEADTHVPTYEKHDIPGRRGGPMHLTTRVSPALPAPDPAFETGSFVDDDIPF